MNLTLYRATAADAPIITGHRRKMFEDIGHTDRAALDAMDAGFEQWVREKLASGEYVGWFLMDDAERVIAGAGLWVSDWAPGPTDASNRRGVIYNVYTGPAYRRKGLARRLMQIILDYCCANEIRTIILHASDEGRALYESMGFVQTNEMRIQLG